MPFSFEIEGVGASVLDVMYRVHTAFGPGAMETVYSTALAAGLRRRGHEVVREHWIGVEFEGEVIERALRADIVVDDTVVVELKASYNPIEMHEAQLLSYLRHGGFPLGYVMNFRVRSMKNGYLRRVNSTYRTTHDDVADVDDVNDVA